MEGTKVSIEFNIHLWQDFVMNDCEDKTVIKTPDIMIFLCYERDEVSALMDVILDMEWYSLNIITRSSVSET